MSVGSHVPVGVTSQVGHACETRINDCQDVDCNDGTCVDRIQSFTCQCDPGFTGKFCEDRITTSVATTMTTTPDGTTSRNFDATLIGVVAGTAVGVVLLVAILTLSSALLTLKLPRASKVLQSL